MQLPGLEFASIDERKVRDYLLALSHPHGKGKAKFFIGLGFQQQQASQLRDALLAHAAQNPVTFSIDTEFGTKYVIDGRLVGSAGHRAWIRAIWFIQRGERIPRFVTAYPSREQRP